MMQQFYKDPNANIFISLWHLNQDGATICSSSSTAVPVIGN